MQYRRITAPGGTFFFTLVTFGRRRIFTDEQAVALLREAFRSVQLNHPFKIEAAVILPDHLHMLWRLPEGDSDYPTRWRLIKSQFTHQWGGTKDIPNTTSRQLKGEQAVWQRHVEYIHYNPVKHGLVGSPVEWRYSSFHTFVKQGIYSPDWGAGEAPKTDLEVGGE
jgi:putative transposase